jgi:regulator of sigma E protease
MLFTIVTTLIVLSILILVHELGHFFAAKKTGIGVEEFGLGYPPRIIGKKIKGTLYSLNMIPFGGFVKLTGEEIEEAERIKEKKKSFWGKSKKVRTGVIVAGVLANFLLAIVCFSIVYSLSGIPTKTDQVKVLEVSENSPAAQAGFMAGDLILAVNEKAVTSMEAFITIVEENKGKEIRVKVAREENNPCQEEVLGGMSFSCEGGNLILFVVPREEPPQGEGSLGVVISEMEMKKYPFWQMPFFGTREGLREAFGWTRLVVEGVSSMISNLVTKGRIPKEIAGPVGILQITSTVARSGILTILQFIGVLSINLAVLNILPFPALDGGRLIFIGYEVVTGKKPNPKIEHWVNLVGIMVLMFLLVLVTLNDLQRIIETTSLGAKLHSIVPF